MNEGSRYERFFDEALELFEGDAQAAERWLPFPPAAFELVGGAVAGDLEESVAPGSSPAGSAAGRGLPGDCDNHCTTADRNPARLRWARSGRGQR